MIEGNAGVMGPQIIGILATLGYSLVVTMAILFVLDKIPGLGLRASEAAEDQGMDISAHGERAFVRDGAD